MLLLPETQNGVGKRLIFWRFFLLFVSRHPLSLDVPRGTVRYSLRCGSRARAFVGRLHFAPFLRCDVVCSDRIPPKKRSGNRVYFPSTFLRAEALVPPTKCRGVCRPTPPISRHLFTSTWPISVVAWPREGPEKVSAPPVGLLADTAAAVSKGSDGAAARLRSAARQRCQNLAVVTASWP